MVSDQDAVRALLKKEKIATLPELKQALGTSATMTVFRKLKAVGYRTSYSHRGKYYTLADIPDSISKDSGLIAMCGFRGMGTCWRRRSGLWKKPSPG